MALADDDGTASVCGIVGIFYKNKTLTNSLGADIAAMLVEMSDRGPDSAGVAIYRDPVGDSIRLSLYCARTTDWHAVGEALSRRLNGPVEVTSRASHGLLTAPNTDVSIAQWLAQYDPAIRLVSSGSSIEILKEKGSPRHFVEQFALAQMTGTHALGHTRMATESAVTTEHSHPFSTGMDLCLVHNGSLSNHNHLRRQLRDQGIAFQTDNDSEVAAGYLMSRLQQGESLTQALESALVDLDGFYTFAIGTRNGFAVLRDPIACKPAVIAETDDWVAMASEYRAIARLSGVEHAEIWEPEPATVYAWGD